MNRREMVLLAAGTLAAESVTRAQAREVPFRIAVLASVGPSHYVSVNELAWLREGLDAEGWFEGRDFLLDARFAEGDYGRFPELLRDLLARRPGAITVSTIAGAKAAQVATQTVPIVMLGLNEPVRSGLVASLSSPGGNVTGLATQSEDVQVKLFRLMQEVLPRARSILVIINSENPSNPSILAALTTEAKAAGLMLEALDLVSASALERMAQSMSGRRPDVVFVLPDIALAGLLDRIVPAATSAGAPTIATFLELPALGGLLAYGFSRRDTVRRAAFYLRRIAQGAQPAELPVEQPTTFRLAVSLRAAAALGLTIPATILARADEVIE